MTISSRGEEDLSRMAADLRRLGSPRIVECAADLSDESAVRNLAGTHRAAYGSMDVLVLNAGTGTAALTLLTVDDLAHHTGASILRWATRMTYPTLNSHNFNTERWRS